MGRVCVLTRTGTSRRCQTGFTVIFVDYRAGSFELIAPLRKLGLQVEKTTLDFGDIMFEGRGEKAEKVLVGDAAAA